MPDIDDELVIEECPPGASGYSTTVMRMSADFPQRFGLYIYGPDLELPVISGIDEEDEALRAAHAVRTSGLHPYLRWVAAEPVLPPSLREEVLYGLKLAARAGRPGVLATQKEMGMEDAAPDVFVECWVDGVRDDPEGCRALSTFAQMAWLEFANQEDPEKAFREMLKIPTLNRQEKQRVKADYLEFLHYKKLADNAAKDLQKREGRGSFWRR